jgi:hypothetical protein
MKNLRVPELVAGLCVDQNQVHLSNTLKQLLLLGFGRIGCLYNTLSQHGFSYFNETTNIGSVHIVNVTI